MKSKTVKLISAVAALGVLSGAYAGVKSYVASQEEKEAEDEEDEEISVVDMDSDEVSFVSYTLDSASVTFEKEDDSWVNKEDKNFPLNSSDVDDAVSGLTSLTASQEIDDVEDLSEYDLDDPVYTITLTDSDGEETSIDIGLENESSSQYYIKKSDEDSKVYVVDSSSIEPFMGNLYDFAEAGTFPSVTSATITEVDVEKENGYTIKENDDGLSWNVSDDKVDESADTSATSSVTSAIGNLSFGDFINYNCSDDSEYGFDNPYAVITVKYTEEEEVEPDEDTDSEADSDTNSTTDSTEEDSSENSDDEQDDTSADKETSEESEKTEETDSDEADDEEDSESEEEEETETITVDKELTIYVGNLADSGRYVKINDSNEVYTISEDSLSDILDVELSDFYNLSVSYISGSLIDSLDFEISGDSHTIDLSRETTVEESDDEDEEATETTTVTYSLDGTEIDSSTFSTFYNKIINMTAQERLTEDYTPESDPSYVFTFNETDGQTVIVNYYEYDSSFYAAVVDDKVYLVNKMNLKDLDTAYEELLNAVQDDSAEDEEAEESESSDSSDTDSDESDSDESDS